MADHESNLQQAAAQARVVHIAKAVQYLNFAGKPNTAEQLKKFACRRFGQAAYDHADTYELGYEVRRLVEVVEQSTRAEYASRRAGAQLASAVADRGELKSDMASELGELVKELGLSHEEDGDV